MNANLKAKLASYSIVGSAFLIHSKIADAQVVCKDYDPDLNANFHFQDAYCLLDLNNDSVTDFVFQVSAFTDYPVSCSICPYISDENLSLIGSLSYGNSTYNLVGVNSSLKALKLNFADTIGPNLSWFWNGSLRNVEKSMYPDTIIYYTDGLWDDSLDHYLPVLLRLNGTDHYGWLRCSLSDHLLIKEDAFNLTPNASILAGQCDYALGTPKLPTTDQVKMIFYDNSLSLKISDPQFEQGELRVYNTEAQTILATDRTATGNNFNLQMVPAGLYYAFYRKNDKVFVLKFAKM